MKPEAFRDLTHEAMEKTKASMQAMQKVIDFLDSHNLNEEKIPPRGKYPELDVLMDAANAATHEMKESIAKLKDTP